MTAENNQTGMSENVVPDRPSRWRFLWPWLVLLLLLAGLALGGSWLAPRALRVARGFQQEVLASLALGVVTIAFYFWRRTSELRESVREHLRSHKVPVYETFLRFWFTILYQGAKQGRQPNQDQLNKFVTENVPGFIFWASDDVIRRWNELRHQWSTMDEAKRKDPTNLFALEELMLSMRKDLGQKNKNLRKGDLLALWINDMQRLVPSKGKSATSGRHSA